MNDGISDDSESGGGEDTILYKGGLEMYSMNVEIYFKGSKEAVSINIYFNNKH